MLLILASFILIFLFAGLYGIASCRVLQIASPHPVIITLLGLCSIMLLSAVYSFFDGLGWIFEGGMLGMALSLAYLFRRDFERLMSDYGDMFLRWSWFNRFCGVLVLLNILVYSAAQPLLPDNESYYIQTIKWIDQHGTVPGLANLHMFLSQGSGWHYAQAALNFDGIVNRLNDLSGFILLLGGVWSIDKLNNFLQKAAGDWLDLASGLFLIPLAFYSQFIGSPSPDIPVYVLTVIVFYEFVELWRKPDKGKFRWVCFLVVCAIFIKVTCVVLALFPAILFFRNLEYYRKSVRGISLIVLMAGGIYLLKNYYLTGYLFFPFINPDLVSPEWQWPRDLAEYFTHLGAIYAYHLTPVEFERLSTWQVFQHWWSLPGVDGLFNKLLVITVTVMPIFLWLVPCKHAGDRKLWFTLYAVFLAQVALLMLTSPQLRFYFNLMLVMYLVLAAVIFQRAFVAVKTMVAISIFAPIAILILLPSNNTVKDNVYVISSPDIEVTHLLVPHPVSRYHRKSYERRSYQGFEYYPPVYDFFYGTGDAPLPAVSTEMLDYMYRNFQVLPQKRGDDLEDGFISRRVENDNTTGRQRK